MKNLFYATRKDKSGHQLTTSYGNAKNAEKYGGKDSNFAETLYHVHFSDDGKAKIGEDLEGPIMRSYMINTGTTLDKGSYEMYGKVNGQWSKTPFTFSQYGNANTAMKAMIGLYEALIIVANGDDEAEAIARWNEGHASISLGEI